MEITCLIIDDEPLAIKLIENFVKRTPFLKLCGSYDNSIEGLAAISERPVNLLFLDIQMPDLNGMELSRLVPKETKIIFTTAFKEYAFDSYEVSALDFLLKPISYSKFIQATTKAQEWFELRSARNGANNPNENRTNDIYSAKTDSDSNDDYLFIRTDSKLQRIEVDNILYISGLKDYVHIYLCDSARPLIVHITMKAVESMLSTKKFMRIHRSYIVAMDKIRSIDRNNCLYIGNEIIRVSDAYKENFNNYLDKRTLR